MRPAACTLFSVLSAFAWSGVIATFLVYSFFIQARGLHPPPCDAVSHTIVWRSSHFCATGREASWWQLNYYSMYVLLGAALALRMAAAGCKRANRHKEQKR
jgi:hypothetical protein